MDRVLPAGRGPTGADRRGSPRSPCRGRGAGQALPPCGPDPQGRHRRDRPGHRAVSPPGQSVGISPATNRAARRGSRRSISSNVFPSIRPKSVSAQRASNVNRAPPTATAMARAVCRARRRGLDTMRTGRRDRGREVAGKRRRLHAPLRAQPWVTPAAVAQARPCGCGMADEHDLGHGPERSVTMADSKVAIPSRIATAATTSPIANAAPVPSPSRRSRSSSGRSPSRSRTTA